MQQTADQSAKSPRIEAQTIARASLSSKFARRAWREIFTRVNLPTLIELVFAIFSAALLILAFPDFNLSFLAWLAFLPLILSIAARPRPFAALLLGWTCGTIFFYGSCYWLTHSMIHYGGIPRPLAFALLVPGALIVGFFPALFAAAFARACQTWRVWHALAFAPFLWTASESLRFQTTGQLWNAVGYSQAFHPTLIQSARWGGVYAVGFLIMAMNAGLTALILSWRGLLIGRDGATRKAFLFALAALALIIVAVIAQVPLRNANRVQTQTSPVSNKPRAIVVAVQPDVSVNFHRTEQEREAILREHFDLSRRGLQQADEKFGAFSSDALQTIPRIVIFPESPANFSYSYDARFRQEIENFTRVNHVSLIFNSLEPAPDNGYYNAALMLDAEGRLAAQYDKIALVPFGERIPLPKWFPLRALVGTIVGEFTPGEKYALMPLGAAKMLTSADGAKFDNQTARANPDANNLRAGVSICVESAYPEIARQFTSDGADVLINITNDGYLGRTAVLRQHLANGVFRAVENARPFLSVTNTGISAYIAPRGRTLDETLSYTTDVRVWAIENSDRGKTIYTRYGDWFAVLCVIISGFAILKRRRI